jgi:hypothetical protein
MGEPVEAARRTRGIAAGRDDARREARPVGQRLAPCGARLGQRGADAGGLRGSHTVRGGQRQRDGTSDAPARDPAGGSGRGCTAPRRDAAGPRRTDAAWRAGDRARGVPDRLHHLRRLRLPDGTGVGSHLRPRRRGAHDAGDRGEHACCGRPPRALSRARRRARLPVGPRRGDARRGPLPRRHHGVRVRCAMCSSRPSRWRCERGARGR